LEWCGARLIMLWSIIRQIPCRIDLQNTDWKFNNKQDWITSLFWTL
jgi:hypothetical protein